MDKEDYKAARLRERQLVKKVFNTSDGRDLLNALAQAHIWDNQLTSDPYQLYARIGQQELVKQLIEICEARDE